MKNEGNRRFYACSAFRDRKQCSFFCWADDRKGKSNRDTTHHNIIADSSTELGNGLMLNRSASRKRYIYDASSEFNGSSLHCLKVSALFLFVVSFDMLC